MKWFICSRVISELHQELKAGLPKGKYSFEETAKQATYSPARTMCFITFFDLQDLM